MISELKCGKTLTLYRKDGIHIQVRYVTFYCLLLLRNGALINYYDKRNEVKKLVTDVKLMLLDSYLD